MTETNKESYNDEFRMSSVKLALESNQPYAQTAKGRGVLCQTHKVKYAWIKSHQLCFKVADMCRALEVQRSGYYHWVNALPSARVKENEQLTKIITDLFIDS